MKLGLFLLFLFISNGLNGQEEDSLYQASASVDIKKDSISVLNKIGNLQLRYNLKKALESNQKALDLANALRDSIVLADVKYSNSLVLFMFERNFEAREMILDNLPHFKNRDKGYKYGILLNRIAKISTDFAEF